MSRSWMQQYLPLPKLIKKRKEEKRLIVKAKVEQDLNFIAARGKYKEDLEPFPEGAFERLHRNNTWEQVLGYFKDPSDITSTYFTCQTFAKMFEERRKLMLLPLTLRILLDPSLGLDDDCSLFNSEALESRGVSKAWKKIVDRELFEADFTGEVWFNEIEEMPEYGDCYEDVMVFRDVKSVCQVLYLLSRSTESDTPLARKLIVDRTAVPEHKTILFRDKILHFLSFYGNSVWFFSYEGKLQMDDYDHLRLMLSKMPNLKALALQWVFKPDYRCEPQELILINDMLQHKPFPVLDSLQYIFFGGDENERWLDHIYRRCTNLKCVTHTGNNLFRGKAAKALRKLPLERIVGPADELILSKKSTWPLKVLELKQMFKPVKRSVLWPAINKFQGTLQTLKIDYYIREDKPWVSLELPHLKRLELNVITEGSIGFDDLIPLKSLENLCVRMYLEEHRPQDEHALVKVFGIQKEMEKSNIWVLFPNLIDLEFLRDGWAYSRKGSTLSLHKILKPDEDEDDRGVVLVRVCQICAE